jgi:hypothetical protein
MKVCGSRNCCSAPIVETCRGYGSFPIGRVEETTEPRAGEWCQEHHVGETQTNWVRGSTQLVLHPVAIGVISKHTVHIEVMGRSGSHRADIASSRIWFKLYVLLQCMLPHLSSGQYAFL